MRPSGYNSFMSTAILDSEKRLQLADIHESSEIVDAQGLVVGRYLPEQEYRRMLYALAESKCPFTAEELERRRLLTGGSSLSSLWQELGVTR